MRYDNPFGFGKQQRWFMEVLLKGYTTNFPGMSIPSMRSLIKKMEAMGFEFELLHYKSGRVFAKLIGFKPIAKDKKLIHPLDKLDRR